MSRATQLAAAVLSAVDFVTQSESAESQAQELTEKKIMVILTYLEKLMMELLRANYLIVRNFFIRGLMGHSSVWVTTALGSCTLGHSVGTWTQAKFVAGNTNVTARCAKLGTEKSLGLFSPGLKDKPGMASI